MPAEAETTPEITNSTLDKILAAQIIVGWAGESGEVPRMGWWSTDFCSEFGGDALFQELLPHTWRWATLQSVRETAARIDARLRSETHDADTVVSLFNLGFVVDERLEDRFQDLKRSGQTPEAALPALETVLSPEWKQDEFKDWVSGHAGVTFEKLPTGRRIRGKLPQSLDLLIDKLIGGLLPLADEYPMPHFRRDA